MINLKNLSLLVTLTMEEEDKKKMKRIEMLSLTFLMSIFICLAIGLLLCFES